MTRVIALILSLAMLASALTLCSAAATKSPFDDVSKKDWFYDYVLSLNADGIVNGKSKTTFAPDDNVTRAEFVKMLGAISMVNNKRFVPEGLTDVGAKDWFAGYVAWAMEAGVTKGTGKTTFAPNDFITRQDMATMIYRFATENAVELKDSKAIAFKDAASIAKYAKNAVSAMQKAGIINGEKSGDGFVFNPTDNATRAEAAKMLCVLFDIIKDTDRYKGYQKLKADLTENADGKTEEGYPLFNLNVGPALPNNPIFRIYISTENGVEQIFITLTQNADASLDQGVTIEPATMTFQIALSALGEDYDSAVKILLKRGPYLNTYYDGKAAELGTEGKTPKFVGYDTDIPTADTLLTEESIANSEKMMGASLVTLLYMANNLDSESNYMAPFGFNPEALMPPVE